MSRNGSRVPRFQANFVNSSCHLVNQGLQVTASIFALTVAACQQDRDAHSTPTTQTPGQETSAGPVWTVFDPDGHVLGFVETPPGLHIYEIGADYLLGHATDEDGIEYVRLWPLERTGAEG